MQYRRLGPDWRGTTFSPWNVPVPELPLQASSKSSRSWLLTQGCWRAAPARSSRCLNVGSLGNVHLLKPPGMAMAISIVQEAAANFVEQRTPGDGGLRLPDRDITIVVEKPRRGFVASRLGTVLAAFQGLTWIRVYSGSLGSVSPWTSSACRSCQTQPSRISSCSFEQELVPAGPHSTGRPW